MNTTYIRILRAIELFAKEHLQIQKFSSDFPEQLPNFATKDEAYPILYVSPSNAVFDLNTNRFDLRVFCYDVIQKDRTNINTILSDTNSILNDLVLWLREGDLAGIDLINEPNVSPINNDLLDYVAGWELTLTLEVDTYTVCDIPFNETPIVTDIVNNIVYASYLTCDTLAECHTFNNAIDNLQEQINNISGGTEFDCNQLSGCTVIQDINSELYGLTSQINTISGNVSSNTSNISVLSGQNITQTSQITTLSAQTVSNTSNISILSANTSNYVPYTGATRGVNLGIYELSGTSIQFNNASSGGKITWNDNDGTLDVVLKGGNVTLQVGQEQVIRAVNKSGIDLLESNYQAVRITGAQGNRLKVELAQANNDLNSAETIGIVTQTILNNQIGYITTNGLVRGINTTGSLQGETWVDGDILYLSPTVAGQLTKIKPVAPQHLVIVGYVVYAHNNQGQIFVKVDNGYELDELHNVSISGTPSNNQALIYNSTTNVWENKSITQSLGYIPLPTTAGTATGTTLSFITDSVYGTIASPITGNITADVTGGQLGVTNIIIHNSGTAPTFSSEFKKLSGSGNYVTGVVNYIYCTFISNTEIIYSINQRT